MTIHWNKEKQNTCVVCDKELDSPGFFRCIKCKKVCQTIKNETSSEMVEIQSACCDALVEGLQKTTCSDTCHTIYVATLMTKFGHYKRIVDAETGESYRVPTRVIIEDGINQQDLKNYPLWND